MTMSKDSTFGIDGYNLPRHEFPVYRGTHNMLPKEKGKGFADIQASYTKGQPGPGEYKTAFKWGCLEKKVSPTRRGTYTDEIFRTQKDKPSAATYTLKYDKVEKRVLGGPMEKAINVNFLSDCEFVAHAYPSPQVKDRYPDKAKLTTLGRCTSVISLKNQKPTDKEWKVKKSDQPGPGHHKEVHKAFNFTQITSP